MQDFKHLEIWRRAHALAIGIHQLTDGFARARHATLQSQLTRAADSISANIVEGCGAMRHKEFARFLTIAIKSANETEHHLIVSRDLRLISPEEWGRCTAEVIEIRKMTFGYRKKLLG